MNTVERTRTEGGLIYNVEETISTQGQCIGKSMDQSTMWKGQGGPLYIVHCRRDRVDQSTVQRSEAVPKYTAEVRGCTKSILQRKEGVPKFKHCPKINGNFS